MGTWIYLFEQCAAAFICMCAHVHESLLSAVETGCLCSSLWILIYFLLFVFDGYYLATSNSLALIFEIAGNFVKVFPFVAFEKHVVTILTTCHLFKWLFILSLSMIATISSLRRSLSKFDNISKKDVHSSFYLIFL